MILSSSSEPGGGPQRRGLSRRTVLGLGATGTAVVAGAANVLSVRAGRGDDDLDQSDRPVVGAPTMPVVRWRLREGLEGWTSTPPGSSVQNDAEGWLVGRATGPVVLESPSATQRRPLDWTLADRSNDDRLTATVRIDGPADHYPTTVTMSWFDVSATKSATSATFDVPTGLEVDIDTWWNCRNSAPPDVLARVARVAVSVDGGADQIEVRVRDVRQPPSTAPWGPPVIGAGSIFFTPATDGLERPAPDDAYQTAVLQKLEAAGRWGDVNHRAMHIGEWGWPKESRGEEPGASKSQTQYALMAGKWMSMADALAIPYTPWGESAYWRGNSEGGTRDFGSYPLANYFCGETIPGELPIISELKPSAAILEQHHGAVDGIPPSINLVGMCFATLQDGSEYSSSNIGVYGRDYFAENPESIEYLHGRGYRLFRLPFRWDRVMRLPEDESLDMTEWGHVEDAIDDILSLPDTSVIVDVQSAQEFWISPSPEDRSVAAVKHAVDGPDRTVSTEMFVNFWLLMSRRLRDRGSRLIYEICNEPRNTSALVVRRFTQAVVSALRADGDRTFCLIPSYPYDSIDRAFAEENHPFPWIVDPAGSRFHAYTLHHYMDLEQSGAYTSSYDETLDFYQSKG